MGTGQARTPAFAFQSSSVHTTDGYPPVVAYQADGTTSIEHGILHWKTEGIVVAESIAIHEGALIASNRRREG